MQAYIARLIVDRIYSPYMEDEIGYIVDKVELVSKIKVFDPATDICLSTTWKVKCINYEKMGSSFICEVPQIYAKEACQSVVEELNKSLRKSQKTSYDQKGIDELEEIRENYQQLACDNWDKENTL